MNNRILLSIIALMLITRVPLHAQTPIQILDKTAAIINGSDGLSGNFTVTTFEGSTPRDKVTGTLQLKGQMYFLKTPQITTWYNGHKMWTYIRNRDLTGAIEALEASVNDCIFGKHQIYYD